MNQKATTPSSSAEQVAFAQTSLDRAIDWVKFADAKAGFVLALVGLLMANALTKAFELAHAFKVGDWRGDWSTLLFAVSLAAAAAAVVFVTLALYPRVTATTKSLAYFGDVQAMTVTTYENAVEELTPEMIITEVSKQTWEVSRIAHQKYRYLKRSYGSALLFLACYSAARLLLVWQG